MTRLGLLLCAVLTGAAPLAAAGPQRVLWRCEVVYQPSRAVWVRRVDVLHDNRQVQRVLIDGVPVYTFAVRDTTILTALDNERVQFDARAQAWASDFRGVASGQGRCEREP